MQTPVHDSGMVRSTDVEIFYRHFPARTVGARRRPLLIVHGLSYLSYDWIDIAGALSAERDVAAIDMRGFGESTWSPARDYGLPALAGDIVAVLDHLGWPAAVLMGHSMGGRVCLCAAGWYPGRVSALVCADFAPDVEAAGRRKVAERIGNQPDEFDSIDHALRYHGHGDTLTDPLLRARYEAFLAPSPGGFRLKRDLHYRDSFREVLRGAEPAPARADLWGLLAGLPMPSLFLRGTHSDMFGARTLPKVHAANPRARTVELEGGHDLAGDNPRGVVDAVNRFLADVPGGAS